MSTPWLKQDWFKLLIALGVIIIALSFVYYFVIFTPNQAKIKNDLAKQELLYKQEQDQKQQELKAAELQAEQDKAAQSQALKEEQIKNTRAAKISRNKNFATCFNTAQDNYDANWANNCKSFGKNGDLTPSCLLPSNIADSIDQHLKDDRDYCYKFWPPQ